MRITAYIILLAGLGISIAFNSQAAIFDFKPTIGNWNVSGNWKSNGVDTAGVPGVLDQAVIVNNSTCTLDTIISVARVRVGDDGNASYSSGSGILNVGSGQSITATEQIAVGDNDRSAIGVTGTLNQTGGSVITLGTAPIYIGNRGADGGYNISGGILAVAGRVYISNPSYASSDGTLTIIGADSTITMDVLDARTNSTIRFVFNDDQGVSTIDAASWAKIAATATLDIVIEPGTVVNKGDVFTLIDGGANLVGQFGNYTDGAIIQFNGRDTFRVNYDVGNNNLLTLTALRTFPGGTIIVIR